MLFWYVSGAWKFLMPCPSRAPLALSPGPTCQGLLWSEGFWGRGSLVSWLTQVWGLSPQRAGVVKTGSAMSPRGGCWDEEGRALGEGGWQFARPDLSAAPRAAGWEAMVLTGRPGATHQSPPPWCPAPGPVSPGGEAGTGWLGRSPLFLIPRPHGGQRKKHSLGPHLPALHGRTSVAFKTCARDTEIPFRVPQEGLCSHRDTTSRCPHLSEGV